LADNNTLSTTYVAPPQYVGDLVSNFAPTTSAAIRIGNERWCGKYCNEPKQSQQRHKLQRHLASCSRLLFFRMIDGSKDGLSFWANNSFTGTVISD